MPSAEQIEKFDDTFGFGSYDLCVGAVNRICRAQLRWTAEDVTPPRLMRQGVPELAQAYCALVTPPRQPQRSHMREPQPRRSSRI